MKRKILSVLFAVVLLVSFSLIPAVPAGAADPTTIASSTMVFQSVTGYTLTYDSGTGTYSGMIPMVRDEGAPPGDGAPGYDVYAKNGATAWFGDDPDKAGALPPDWTSVAIVNNDGWPEWDVDTPDWYQYSLKFYDVEGVQKWRVANHSGANADNDPWYDDGDQDVQLVEQGVPMSGTMDWVAMYATETDIGEYLDPIDPLTHPEIPGGAAAHGGGAACWDMDWSWGSEAVPLQYAGFAVTVTDLGGGDYRVTMAPAARAQINRLVPSQYGTIQAAVTAAGSGDTIIVAAGVYDEQVVINKSLTLQGVGDTTVIQPSGPGLMTTTSIPWFGGTNTMAAIVSVEATGDEVTIRDLKIDGSLITTTSTTWVAGLVYLETSGTIEDLTVIGYPDINCRSVGIWASALTETAPVEVTECTIIDQNRAGIYAYGATITADYHHNEINGPGELADQVPNGFFFLEGAKGSATYNTITDMAYDGEIYRSSGIGTYRPGADLIFGHNEIYNVQNAFAIAGGLHATIEYSDIHDCHTGVKLEAIGENSASNTNIQYNDIYDNDFAIRCGLDMGDGNEAHYNNFVGNLGAEWIWGDDTWIGAVCNVHETYILDATNNWWGTILGPTHATNPGGTGGSVSDKVVFNPWLTAEVGDAAVAMTAETPQIVAISVDPTSINFGTLYPGENSAQIPLTISNIGTVDAGVTTLILDAAGVPVVAMGDFFWDNLHLFPPGAPGGKAHLYATTSPLLVGGAAATPLAQVRVPPNYAAVGTVTGTLVFVAAGP